MDPEVLEKKHLVVDGQVAVAMEVGKHCCDPFYFCPIVLSKFINVEFTFLDEDSGSRFSDVPEFFASLVIAVPSVLEVLVSDDHRRQHWITGRQGALVDSIVGHSCFYDSSEILSLVRRGENRACAIWDVIIFVIEARHCGYCGIALD